MKNLDEMSIDELKQLIKDAQEKLREKEKSEKIFTFHFEFENDPRKGKPYAARLYIKDGELQRDFFDLNQTWGKNSVLVEGDYTAHTGDVIEEREGGSWKNDYRYWYVINENGEKVFAADIDDSKAKAIVLKYLKGKITLKEILEQISHKS